MFFGNPEISTKKVFLEKIWKYLNCPLIILVMERSKTVRFQVFRKSTNPKKQEITEKNVCCRKNLKMLELSADHFGYGTLQNG